MTRYEVSRNFYGRPIVKHGPAQGCADFPQHKWERITPRPVGLARAKELANSEPGRAVVTPWQAAGAVYDNGKAPLLPDGWLPEPFR